MSSDPLDFQRVLCTAGTPYGNKAGEELEDRTLLNLDVDQVPSLDDEFSAIPGGDDPPWAFRPHPINSRRQLTTICVGIMKLVGDDRAARSTLVCRTSAILFHQSPI